MTSVEIYKDINGNILGWQAKGHTGYAGVGKDIVCAAISTITQATILQMNMYKIKFSKTISNGYMKVILANYNAVYSKKYLYGIQFALKTLQLVLNNIMKQYPDFISVKEVIINESIKG